MRSEPDSNICDLDMLWEEVTSGSVWHQKLALLYGQSPPHCPHNISQIYEKGVVVFYLEL